MYDKLVNGIKDYFAQAGFTKAVVGISGGIDSAVTISLAIAALGKENVTGLSMPSHISSDESYTLAKSLSENLGFKLHQVPIASIYTEFESVLKPIFKDMPKDVTEENMQARIRAIILMSYANKFKALVVNTGNKTEAYLGYCTLYGDSIGAIAPLANVNKKQVYELAQVINKEKELIPLGIINRIPTAELSDGQTDEASLGASYDILVPLVDDIVDGKTRSELLKSYDPQIVDKVLDLVKKSKFKRDQVPPGIKF